MTEPYFDPSVYTTTPTATLAAMTVLARTLVTVAPRGLSALGQRSLARLDALANSSQSAQALRQSQLSLSGEEPRTIDVLGDRAVGAVKQRLDAYAVLSAKKYPRAPRAAELSEQLFPEGLVFLNLPYVEQLAAMEVLVARIDAEKLDKDLDALCGPEFLDNLRTVLPQYREMVQQGLKQVDQTENLQEHRRKLGAAIADYATKVAALYDADDETSAERIRTALRPIDALREQLSRRSSANTAAPAPPAAESGPSALT